MSTYHPFRFPRFSQTSLPELSMTQGLRHAASVPSLDRELRSRSDLWSKSCFRCFKMVSFLQAFGKLDVEVISCLQNWLTAGVAIAGVLNHAPLLSGCIAWVFWNGNSVMSDLGLEIKHKRMLSLICWTLGCFFLIVLDWGMHLRYVIKRYFLRSLLNVLFPSQLWRNLT